MSENFSKLSVAVAAKANEMAKRQLFLTDVSKDDMWQWYLASFPEGSNPIYRERTEHDCACCRGFIKGMGNAVNSENGKITTIWDIIVDDPVYQTVADAMSQFVKSSPIRNIFLRSERKVGVEKNYEQVGDRILTWNHFYFEIPLRNEHGFLCAKADIGPKHSEARATHDVLKRGLIEITPGALDTVLEVINQGSLYRGDEHKFAIESFLKVKKQFPADESARDLFVWSQTGLLPGSVSKIRNTSIGTLLVDLSNGVELDRAIRSFEVVVAPANYKRPTATVTKSMVDAAKTRIEEVGLTSALERRYAHISDITINNILFVDRDSKKALKGDVFDMIDTRPASPRNLDRVQEIPIEKFLSDIIPNATSLEVMFDGKHSGNLVSLIAPVHATAALMFKWDNPFSWSYNGDFADSVKERVKKAGGNVTGDLCCRLAWSNHDDLDFHMREPVNHEIYYANKRIKSPSGGMLDVDMNAGHGTTREPVENIFYASCSTMKEGIYRLSVHNFAKRESTNVGFDVEIDYLGTVYRFAYDRPVKDHETITVASFKYSHKNGMEITESLPMSTSSKTMWGIKTNEFHKVSVLMMSPNFWNDKGVGPKHYFFMLAECKNDGQARGFFNEFLKDELTPHRKVLELVGNKMKTDESENQLSGLGFSSTQRNDILVKVSGNFTRIVKVVF